MNLYQAMSAESEFMCALWLDGPLQRWGNDEASEKEGQLDVPQQGTYEMVNAGDDGSCALRDDGCLKC